MDDLDSPVSDGEQAILDMVLALKKGDAPRALAVAEIALAAAQNAGLEARVRTWWAQALRMTGDTSGARVQLGQALARAEEAADAEGVASIRKLIDETPPPARPPAVPTPVGLAVEAMDRGELARGELLALGAHRLAQNDGDVREQILALLALARIPHRTADAIEQATRLADEAADPNLVTACAKARKAAGLPARKHVF